MKLDQLFELQKNLFIQKNKNDLSERIKKIKKIKSWIKKNKN
jgi:hypothetical protein